MLGCVKERLDDRSFRRKLRHEYFVSNISSRTFGFWSFQPTYISYEVLPAARPPREKVSRKLNVRINCTI